MLRWSFERTADWFLPSPEKGKTSSYLLRKRVFVYANIIQLSVTLVALLLIPLFVVEDYPADQLLLLVTNGTLSALFLGSTKLELDYERPAFFYVVALLINLTVAVFTSGGGASYLLSWYVVVAVAIAFFLHGWRRNTAAGLLTVTLAVLTLLVLNQFPFLDNTTELFRPLLSIGSLWLSVFFCGLLGTINSGLFDRHNNVLANQAYTDPLTGLLNRRGFIRQVELQENNSLLMLDIDHFKRFNDQYGHNAGDRVLVHLAEKVRSVIRDKDKVVRLGGEEFAVWFQSTDAAQLKAVVKRITAAISEPIGIADGQDKSHIVRVHVSGGLVTSQPNESLESLLARADETLYRAKAAGRNQVLTA